MTNAMRQSELENRNYGDFDMADMCREAAEAEEKGCRTSQRMALRRVMRFINDQRGSFEKVPIELVFPGWAAP